MAACVVKCPNCGTLNNSSVTNGTTRCKNCGSTIYVRNGRAKFLKNGYTSISKDFK